MNENEIIYDETDEYVGGGRNNEYGSETFNCMGIDDQYENGG